MTENFRVSMTREQLLLTTEALVNYAKKLYDEPAGHPGKSGYPKVKDAASLVFNLQLFLSGEKKTGRRRTWHPWKDSIEGLSL